LRSSGDASTTGTRIPIVRHSLASGIRPITKRELALAAAKAYVSDDSDHYQYPDETRPDSAGSFYGFSTRDGPPTTLFTSAGSRFAKTSSLPIRAAGSQWQKITTQLPSLPTNEQKLSDDSAATNYFESVTSPRTGTADILSLKAQRREERKQIVSAANTSNTRLLQQIRVTECRLESSTVKVAKAGADAIPVEHERSDSSPIVQRETESEIARQKRVMTSSSNNSHVKLSQSQSMRSIGTAPSASLTIQRTENAFDEQKLFAGHAIIDPRTAMVAADSGSGSEHALIPSVSAETTGIAPSTNAGTTEADTGVDGIISERGSEPAEPPFGAFPARITHKQYSVIGADGIRVLQSSTSTPLLAERSWTTRLVNSYVDPPVPGSTAPSAMPSPHFLPLDFKQTMEQNRAAMRVWKRKRRAPASIAAAHSTTGKSDNSELGLESDVNTGVDTVGTTPIADDTGTGGVSDRSPGREPAYLLPPLGARGASICAPNTSTGTVSASASTMSLPAGTLSPLRHTVRVRMPPSLAAKQAPATATSMLTRNRSSPLLGIGPVGTRGVRRKPLNALSYIPIAKK
jgi:hypothetical protein